MKIRELFIALIYMLSYNSLPAETNLRVFYGRNTGELIFEGGRRWGADPKTGISGSRLTYRKDFNLAGIGAEHVYGKWRLSASYASSGGYVDSGGAKDQDFPLGMSSKESYSGLDTSKWRITDSAYVFSGMPYYADVKGLSVIDYHNVATTARYNLHEDESYRFYLSVAADLSYSKYTIYDASVFYSFPNRQPVHGFIPGRGIVVYNKKSELPFGAGMALRVTDSLETKLEALFIVGLNRARMNHINRGFKIDTNNAGHGMSFSMILVKNVNDTVSIGLNYRNYRYYSIPWSKSRASPGYEDLDGIIISAITNGNVQDSHINEKEYRVELFVERRFGF